MQNGIVRVVPVLFVLSTVAVLSAVLAADTSSFATPKLTGYEENPARSSPASGEFRATINSAGTAIDYELTYSGFTTPVREAHLHLGRARVNGGIMVFLCSNLPNPPANTPACPTPSGTVKGSLTAASVVGPADQGIAPGEFDEVLAAIRARAAYANVHTEQFPAGEIRNQVLRSGDVTDNEDNDDNNDSKETE